MDQVETVARKLKVVWLALLASIVLYAMVAQMVKAQNVDSAPGAMVHGAFLALAILFAGVAVVFRQRKVRPFEEEVRSGRVPTGSGLNAEQTAMMNSWQAGQLISMVLCESVALFGLVLQFLGTEWLKAAPFYAVAALLLVMWMPRRPG